MSEVVIHSIVVSLLFSSKVFELKIKFKTLKMRTKRAKEIRSSLFVWLIEIRSSGEKKVKFFFVDPKSAGGLAESQKTIQGQHKSQRRNKKTKFLFIQFDAHWQVFLPKYLLPPINFLKKETLNCMNTNRNLKRQSNSSYLPNCLRCVSEWIIKPFKMCEWVFLRPF